MIVLSFGRGLKNEKIKKVLSRYLLPMSCFICLSTKKPLIKPDCVCKNIYAHTSCYKQWLDTCPDMFTCSVCKTNLSVTFIKPFVTVEKLMLYSENQENEEDDQNIFFSRRIISHGVVVTLDDNDDWWFDTIEDLGLYTESSKREFKALHQLNRRVCFTPKRPLLNKKQYQKIFKY